jgi:hypothetical protein
MKKVEALKSRDVPDSKEGGRLQHLDDEGGFG